jgi:hypothetical protein
MPDDERGDDGENRNSGRESWWSRARHLGRLLRTPTCLITLAVAGEVIGEVVIRALL